MVTVVTGLVGVLAVVAAGITVVAVVLAVVTSSAKITQPNE